MSASANEAYNLVCCGALKLVDKQEIAADVAFAMVGSFTFQWVIKPFRPERPVVGDE